MVRANFYDDAPSLPGSHYTGSVETSGRCTSEFFKAVVFSLRARSQMTGEDTWAFVFVNDEYYCTMLYSPVLEGVSIVRANSLSYYWMDKGAMA